MSKKISFASAKPQVKPSSADNWVGEGAEKEGRAALQVVPDPQSEKPRKMVRFTLDVDADLHSRMKVACAMKGEKMSDVLRTILAKEFPPRA